MKSDTRKTRIEPGPHNESNDDLIFLVFLESSDDLIFNFAPTNAPLRQERGDFMPTRRGLGRLLAWRRVRLIDSSFGHHLGADLSKEVREISSATRISMLYRRGFL